MAWGKLQGFDCCRLSFLVDLSANWRFWPIPASSLRTCIFRRNSTTDSDSNRPLIPIQFDHRFRRNSASDSG